MLLFHAMWSTSVDASAGLQRSQEARSEDRAHQWGQESCRWGRETHAGNPPVALKVLVAAQTTRRPRSARCATEKHQLYRMG